LLILISTCIVDLTFTIIYLVFFIYKTLFYKNKLYFTFENPLYCILFIALSIASFFSNTFQRYFPDNNVPEGLHFRGRHSSQQTASVKHDTTTEETAKEEKKTRHRRRGFPANQEMVSSN